MPPMTMVFRVAEPKMLDAVSDKDLGWPSETERGITIRVHFEEGDTKKPLTFLVLDKDDPLKGVPKWAEDLFPGEFFCCAPRGYGKSAWTQKSPPNYVERSLALLGQTADTGRVRDVAAAFLDYRRQAMNRQWQIGGKGQAGILAAYAAIFEPDIPEVVLVEPPATHRDGPYFLNVLRVLDIPDALGLLAPRPLTIYSNDKAFARTAEIYKRAGAADKFKIVEVKKP